MWQGNYKLQESKNINRKIVFCNYTCCMQPKNKLHVTFFSCIKQVTKDKFSSSEITKGFFALF